MSTPTIDVEGLRRSIDIVEFISRFVELRKVGSEYRGLCPWHDDHTPSLAVNPNKRVWSCFACGAHEDGADVFGFVMKWEGCTFPEAIAKLGNGVLPAAKPIVRPSLKRIPRRTFPHPKAELPDMEHRELGLPVKIWTIR